VRVLVAGAALAAVVAACAGAQPYEPRPLAGRTFVATEFVSDGEHRPVWVFGALTLQFAAAGRGFLADAACNSVHGTYGTVRGRLRLEQGGAAGSGCGVDGTRAPQGYDRIPERWHVDVGSLLGDPLADLYRSEPDVLLRGGTIVLTTARGRLTLREFRDTQAIARAELPAVRATRADPRWRTTMEGESGLGPGGSG
jgi:hypothetical protein